MRDYHVTAWRIDAHGSRVHCKDASIDVDTDPAGREDAFNPAELLLAALASCMLKGIERVTPMLRFRLSGARLALRATRQDSPPKIIAIDYELVVETDESDHRLDLLHTNIRKFGTITNTLAGATRLEGRIRRSRGDGDEPAITSAVKDVLHAKS